MFHKGITTGYHETKVLSKEIELELFYVQGPILKVEPRGKKKKLSHTFLFSGHYFFHIFGKFNYLHIL